MGITRRGMTGPRDRELRGFFPESALCWFALVFAHRVSSLKTGQQAQAVHLQQIRRFSRIVEVALHRPIQIHEEPYTVGAVLPRLLRRINLSRPLRFSSSRGGTTKKHGRPVGNLIPAHEWRCHASLLLPGHAEQHCKVSAPVRVRGLCDSYACIRGSRITRKH